jgi:hypothetical protein
MTHRLALIVIKTDLTRDLLLGGNDSLTLLCFSVFSTGREKDDKMLS